MKNKFLFKTVLYLLLAALFLAMAACGPDPFYIWVEFIEGVPENGTAGTPLTLAGNVRPVFASNKDIVWSVKNAGTTGANINGNILNANAGGTVTIKAIIANGIAKGKDFTQDFKIVFGDGSAVVEPITHAAITVTGPAKNGIPHTTAAPADASAHYTIGAVSWTPADNPFKGVTVYTATVTLTADTGYTFTGLTAATINGHNANVSGNTGAAVTVSYTFAATLDKEITGITIKAQPTKLTYIEGDALDLSGLVVTLAFDTGSPEDVAFDNFDSYNISANPAHGDTLTVAHNGQPVTVAAGDYSHNTGNLTVSGKEITGITIKTQPTKLTYTEGDALDLSGLVVTLAFNTGSPEDVVFDNFDSYYISANPAHGDILTLAHNGQPVTVAAGDYSHNTGNLTVSAAVYPPAAAVTITFAQITDDAPNIDGPTLSRSGTNHPKTAAFEIDGSGYDSISWEITGTGFSGTGISGTGYSFTLDAADVRYNRDGDHHLTLTVYKDGIPYNKIIIFRIVQ